MRTPGSVSAIVTAFSATLIIALAYVLVSRPDGARWAIVLGIAFPLTILSLVRPPIAVAVFLSWAPFLALTRRAIYVLSPYTSLDPILLVGPAACALILSVAFVFRREHIAAAVRESYASGAVAALLLVFLLEIFNPLQGSLLVGFGGVLFFAVPLAWFVVGRLYVDRRAARYLAGMLVVVSCITSAYGLHQAYNGYLPFETYWLEHGGYAALSVFGVVRPVSTFTSSAEFVTFATCGLVVAVSTLLCRRRGLYLIVLPALPVVAWAILTNGSRGVIVRFIGAIVVLLSLRASSASGRAIGALLASIVILIGISQWSYRPGQYVEIPVVGTFLERQAQGLSDPLGEHSTLPAKLNQLRAGVVGPLLQYPLGLGLGAPTLAGAKFGSAGQGLELDLSDVFIAGGLAGGALYLALTLLLARQVVRLWLVQRDWLFAALAAVFVVMIGGALIGGHYALTPLWWTLMGWLDREYAAAWPLRQANTTEPQRGPASASSVVRRAPRPVRGVRALA